MRVWVLAALLSVLWCGAAAYRHNELVPLRWREDSSKHWATLYVDMCPRFGVATQVMVPRSVSSDAPRTLEFSLDARHAFVTPPLLLWHPETRLALRAVTFTVTHDAQDVLALRHEAEHHTLPPGANPERVIVELRFVWHSSAAHHTAWSASLSLWILLGAAVVIVTLVSADEVMRSAAFLHPTQVPELSTLHPSVQSPLVKRRVFRSREASPQQSPSLARAK